MVSVLLSRSVIVIFGTLYPAYRSYKAVRFKDVKEYVKWMMYWIVFALFSCAEVITDVFVSFWLPFYYELKILFVLWLLSPYTKGASYLYRKLIHPTLSKHEPEIDLYLDQLQRSSYDAVMRLGNQGWRYAKDTVVNVAVRSQLSLIQQMNKTQSLSDLRGNDDLVIRGAARALPYPGRYGEITRVRRQRRRVNVSEMGPVTDNNEALRQRLGDESYEAEDYEVIGTYDMSASDSMDHHGRANWPSESPPGRYPQRIHPRVGLKGELYSDDEEHDEGGEVLLDADYEDGTGGLRSPMQNQAFIDNRRSTGGEWTDNGRGLGDTGVIRTPNGLQPREEPLYGTPRRADSGPGSPTSH